MQNAPFRDEAEQRQQEQGHSAHASHASHASYAAATAFSAASAREAPATGGAAAGGGAEPPPPGAAHQAAVDFEQVRLKQWIELRVREVRIRMQEVCDCPSLMGEQLFQATKDRNTTVIRQLRRRGVDINYPDASGCTPLHQAILAGAHEVVTCLLELRADVNAVNIYGCSAMHFAARSYGILHLVYQLVDARCDVNARDLNGETPLHRATFCKNEIVLRELLITGARRDLVPWSGRWENLTPYDIAPPFLRDLLRFNAKTKDSLEQ